MLKVKFRLDTRRKVEELEQKETFVADNESNKNEEDVQKEKKIALKVE